MDMLRKYEEAVQRYIDKYMKDERIEGVMHLGAVARQRADEYSDIDIAVFSLKPIDDIKFGEQQTYEGYDIDIFSIVMIEIYDSWDQIRKEAYAEGKIIFDRKGLVIQFLDKALQYSDEYRMHFMAQLIFKMAWHGWIYSPFRNKFEKGYNWILPEDLWYFRNDKNNPYYVTQVSTGYFIELIYALNRKWTPDYKWRLIKSQTLKHCQKIMIKKSIIYCLNLGMMKPG